MEKIFTTAYLRELDDLFARDEISYSRIVEILNEKANAAVASEKQRWVEKIKGRIKFLKSHVGFAYDTRDRIEELENLLKGEK